MAKILVLDDMRMQWFSYRKFWAAKATTWRVLRTRSRRSPMPGSKEVDLLILDIKLKKLSGIEVLREIKKAKPEVKAMMLTGYPTLESAREALQTT
jgi:DNA-binding NtrC family response regulator